MIGNRFWSPDVGVGVVCGLLGIGYLVGAMTITPDPSQFNVMGPRVAPVTIGIATVVCSAALIVQALLSRRRSVAAEPTPKEEEEPEQEQSRSLQQLLVTFCLFAGYILVFIPLGYLLSTVAFLIALTTYVEPRKPIRNCVFAVAFAGVVYVLFTRGLRVELPPGLLG